LLSIPLAPLNRKGDILALLKGDITALGLHERQRMINDDNLERMASILAFVGVRLLQLKESLFLPFNQKSQGRSAKSEPDECLSCS